MTNERYQFSNATGAGEGAVPITKGSVTSALGATLRKPRSVRQAAEDALASAQQVASEAKSLSDLVQSDETTRRDTSHLIGAAGPSFVASVDQLSSTINGFMRYQGFWESENVGEKLMLIVTEIAEACEADRAGNPPDDKISAYSGLEAELADAAIRIFDLAAQKQLRLGAAIIAKMQFNLTRPRKHGKGY
jgi:NTP pyrophosphatase (non-canonical NTP hydrolase)